MIGQATASRGPHVISPICRRNGRALALIAGRNIPRPHLVVLFCVLLGWFVTRVIAWFAIVFTGAYPAALSRFGIGAMRWLLRVEAYLLLLVDEYPPFTLD